MATGLKYQLDLRLLVSLAGAEPGFGAHITPSQYNAKVINEYRIYSLDSRRGWPALAYHDRLPALPRHASPGWQMMAWAGA
ncbi:MAG TPA: hypothetical protein VNE63_18610 [Candidatus Acidoferrales bacterium]|nr:hypothetical protein [Candidatus Acidoferrales bacterium]